MAGPWQIENQSSGTTFDLKNKILEFILEAGGTKKLREKGHRAGKVAKTLLYAARSFCPKDSKKRESVDTFLSKAFQK